MRNIRVIMSAGIFAVMSICSSFSWAEPTGDPVNIVTLRSYNNINGAGVIFMTVSPSSICGTDTFKIDLSYGGSKEIYATALAALLSSKQVKVEVADSTGCTGWGTTVQSLYILQ